MYEDESSDYGKALGLASMECFFSTSAFPTRNLAHIVDLGLEGAIDIELGAAIAPGSDLMLPLHNARGRLRFLVHNYFPPPADPFVLNLASPDVDIHRRSIALCRQAIALCADLQAPFYSVHAGFAMNLLPNDLGDPLALARAQVVPHEEAYGRFLETVGELALWARRHGVELLVENNVMTASMAPVAGPAPLLLAEKQEIVRFFRDIGDSAVGLLFDTGHAKVTAGTLGESPEAFIDEVRPFIRALHLNDNGGHRDEHLSFDHSVWFGPFLPGLAHLPMIVEVNHLDLGAMLEQRRVVFDLAA